jgi:hypothetical protein
VTRQAWILVGILALAAIGTGWLVTKKDKGTDDSTNTQSQLPSEMAQANYTVPPSIGVTENPPTHAYMNGQEILTQSQGNSLPINQQQAQ